jgi:hypothetical protein
MKTGYQLLLIVLVIVGLASCQKEVSREGDAPAPLPGTPAPADTIPNKTNTEVGSWKFMSVKATLAQTTEYSEASQSIKGVTTSNFTSQNNAGTVTFDNTTMTATDVTMSLNTTAQTVVFINGAPYDTLQSPLNQTLPPQTASSPYKKIGADSLYFENGGFLDVLTGGILPSAPSGCKLAFEGSNIMKMTIIYDTVTTQDYQGTPAKLTIHMVMVVTLQKN